MSEKLHGTVERIGSLNDGLNLVYFILLTGMVEPSVMHVSLSCDAEALQDLALTKPGDWIKISKKPVFNFSRKSFKNLTMEEYRTRNTVVLS